MLIFGRNQIRDQQVGERSLQVVVAQRKCSGRIFIQEPFQLETKIADAGCENRIFTVTFSRESEA